MTLLAATAVAACQAKGQPRAVEVVLRDAQDAAVLTLVRTATGCTAEPGALAITASGTNGTAAAGELMLAPGPVGPELRTSAGTIARVVTEDGPPRRLSIIDPIGVPMVRMTFAADGVTAADAARAPVGRIENTADGLRFVTTDDKQGGGVTGAADVALADRFAIAAPLLAPAELPLPARALLACERLAAVTPAVK